MTLFWIMVFNIVVIWYYLLCSTKKRAGKFELLIWLRTVIWNDVGIKMMFTSYRLLKKNFTAHRLIKKSCTAHRFFDPFKVNETMFSCHSGNWVHYSHSLCCWLLYVCLILGLLTSGTFSQTANFFYYYFYCFVN